MHHRLCRLHRREGGEPYFTALPMQPKREEPLVLVIDKKSTQPASQVLSYFSVYIVSAKTVTFNRIQSQEVTNLLTPVV